jgi:hypothetical protein
MKTLHHIQDQQKDLEMPDDETKGPLIEDLKLQLEPFRKLWDL